MPNLHAPLVYYARRGDLIKIGTSTNVRKRLADIGVDELLAVEPGSFDLETARHDQFAAHQLSRKRGKGNGGGKGPTDWFRPGDDLMAHIEALAAVHPRPAMRSRRAPSEHGGHGVGSQEYNNLHHRMRRQRGKASLHLCTECGETAAHWAQLHETSGLDIWADYAPMCIKCHRAYDQGGRSFSAEHRAALAESARNRPAEHLQKISDALKGRPGWSPGMTGKHHSEETRKRISAVMKGVPQDPARVKKRIETLARRKREREAAAAQQVGISWIQDDLFGGLHVDRPEARRKVS